MAESLFERVNDGYHELTVSKKYMTNCSPKIIKYHIREQNILVKKNLAAKWKTSLSPHKKNGSDILTIFLF